MLSVGFLPFQELGPKMGQLCGMQATTQLHQKHPELQDLLRYFYNTWFIMHRPEVWNVFERPESLPTNNSIERRNASRNNKIANKKNKHKTQYIACNSIFKGGRNFNECPFGADWKRRKTTRARKKWRELNENNAVLKQQLTSAEKNLDEYWISIGSLCANDIWINRENNVVSQIT